jgi:hypothetical protein
MFFAFVNIAAAQAMSVNRENAAQRGPSSAPNFGLSKLRKRVEANFLAFKCPRFTVALSKPLNGTATP